MFRTDLRGWLGKRLIFLFLVPLLATGCQTAPTSDSSSPTPESITALELSAGQVEPGVGTQEVKIGMTQPEVEQALGAATEEDKNEFVEGQSFLLYYPKGIELTLQDGKVEMITLHPGLGKWSAYTGGTPEGVGPSSTAKDVKEALGPPDEEAPRAMIYTAKGLWFRFDQDITGDPSNARAESLSVISPEGSQ